MRIFFFVFLLIPILAFCDEAASFDLMSAFNGSKPKTNLAWTGTPPIIHWDVSKKPGFWIFPAQTDWSSYNAISFRIESARTGKDEILFQLVSNPPDSKNNYYYARIKIDHTGWKTYTFLFSKLGRNRNPAGFQSIQTISFHSEGWGLKHEEGFSLKIDSIQLKSIPAEELKKKLPPSGKVTAWPEGTAPEEIRKWESAPDFQEKRAALESMRRNRLPENYPFRNPEERKKEAERLLDLIRKDGSFSDLTPDAVYKRAVERRDPNALKERVEESICAGAAGRLRLLLLSWNNGTIPRTDENKRKLFSAMLYYFDMDYQRNSFRWIASCFLLPRVAAEGYFTFLREMDAVEAGSLQDPDIMRLNRLCKAIVMQSFTEQERKDVKELLTEERFRGHPHWVGGNFGYRPLLDCALICRNPAMADLIARVCSKALSVTSWNTRKDSFWQEGFTADSAGWGHGMQNYLFGYPLDGLRTVLQTLERFKGTVWESSIPVEKYRLAADYLETLLWFSYAPRRYGATLMAPGRIGIRFYEEGGFSTYPYSVADSLERLVPDSAAADKQRVKTLKETALGKRPEPVGVRYFWNNDDLIARGKDFFIGINMTSARSASNEVVGAACSQTEFLGDGTTFLMKRPETYRLAKGFWNSTEIPGVTARKSARWEHPVDVWEGFSGVHNFAGGVQDGSLGACAFLYEKQKGWKFDVPAIYGVQAQKSYFIFGNRLLCLGSGITNLNPALPGEIVTTVDWTEFLEAPEYTVDGGKIPRPEKQDFSAEAKHSLAVCHGGVGYFLRGKSRLAVERRKERWLEFDRNFNEKQSRRPRELTLLGLEIDHGREAKDAGYEYIVEMGCGSLKEFLADLKDRPIRVLAQDRFVHAAAVDAPKALAAVFFSPQGSFSDGTRVWRSDSPAVVLIREKADGSAVMTVSDPEQNPQRKSVTLRCDHPFHGKTEFTIPLPGGVMCGKAGVLAIAR